MTKLTRLAVRETGAKHCGAPILIELHTTFVCFREIGCDGRNPIGSARTFRPLNLVRAREGVIVCPNKSGCGVGGIQALIGIYLSREVRLARDLPTTDVNRFRPVNYLSDCRISHKAPIDVTHGSA